MKKLVLLFAAAAMAVSVSAQTVTESKTFDNFYIGVNGGARGLDAPAQRRADIGELRRGRDPVV